MDGQSAAELVAVFLMQITLQLVPAEDILFKWVTAAAGVKRLEDTHASQVLLAAADIAVAVLAAAVLLVVVELAAVGLALLHSLTLVVAAVVVADTVQTSAGTVIQDILVVMVAADLLDLTIVLHTVQAVVVAQEF